MALSNKERAIIGKIREARWRCRWDLLYLCNKVLGYPKVSLKLNGLLLDRLQKFPMPAEQTEQMEEHDPYDEEAREWKGYRPLVRMEDLPGKRRFMCLDSRSFLKTTIMDIAHTVQWIINYPDVSVMIFQGSRDNAELILGELKQHFVSNPKFRQLFPEHCPPEDTKEFGKIDRFTTMARPVDAFRKEATVQCSSLGSQGAGLHFHVIKCSDVVNEQNYKSPSELMNTIDKFEMAENLLVSATLGWIDIDGTRYDFNDLYGKIIRDEKKRQSEEVWRDGQLTDVKYRPQPEKRLWSIYINCCFERTTSPKIPRLTYDYDDLEAPLKLDDEGQPLSRWPEEWPTKRLLDYKSTNPFLFASQRMNNPIGGIDGKPAFPVEKPFPKTVSTDVYRKIPIAYRELAIDTAETMHGRSSFTAMVVGAWDTYGRLYIEHITHGKFSGQEIIDRMFNLYITKRCTRLLMERVPFNMGLSTSIDREQELRNTRLNIELLIRTGGRMNMSKQDRIRGGLEAPYREGNVLFVYDPPTERPEGHHSQVGISHAAWSAVFQELRNFPADTMDILDCLNDLWVNREYTGRVLERAGYEDAAEEIRQAFHQMIFDPYAEMPQSMRSIHGDLVIGGL